jgi:methylmalonyl-CoA mutase, N-terminal domain
VGDVSGGRGKAGRRLEKISGTIQNDILKEYIAQKEYIYPPAPSMRLVIDTFEFGSKFTPRFNTISISGYHIREAGSTAAAGTGVHVYDGVEYVEWARRRGLDVDDFGPRLSFLLQRAQRFLRGDRQVPRRAQDLGQVMKTASARRTSAPG